ncbi:dnaJ homolog subfamily B member 14-like isoform X2 [Varroa jacobsoni]|uniref:J domain-containing protein n=1 Tax=Varroa destructor TaxID=109461 RepID=A0A7M7J4X4_VARDE|nr:dnaJ homolog subfamily B member 14-like isoform X2 [Varroa destructor]XP_022700177.1 dnaJ homolog subfamily B member 14-like isoform X2 [Varroa jacobsoni]
MESNREDALQAIRVAKKALQDGDQEKAKRLLQKSIRLCPTDCAKELLASLVKDNDQENQPNDGDAGSPRSKHRNGAGEGTQKTDGAKNSASRGASPARAEYTPEQAEAVKRITKCKNYYEVLEVEKESFAESELKKKYRKLALLVHPDKNCAPGAAEAFKKVGNAYGVLSDNRKKAEYDANLNRPIDSNRGGNYGDYNTTHFETSADITPEELFNVFFGGGSFAFEGVNRRRRQAYHHRQNFHHHHQQQQGSETGQTSLILQTLPILVLLGMSLLSSFLAQDPPYSLIQSSKYPHERVTMKFKVPYFVQDGFSRDFNRNSILRLEEQIEAEFIINLRHSCFRERQNRDAMLWRARHTGNSIWATRAKEVGVPSCDRLADLHVRA